jgi:hypothetical protein
VPSPFQFIEDHFSIPAALYCLGGILQAGSLFTGERAQRNFNFWGSLFLACCMLFVACVVALWRGRRPKSQSAGAVDRAD